MVLPKSLLACVLLSIVTLSLWVQGTSGTVGGRKQKAKPCCWPSKMSGTMIFTTPDMTIMSLTYFSDFDEGRSIEFFDEFSPNPMHFLYRDFKNMKTFLMFRDGSCKEFPMGEGEYVQCMPDDARLANTIEVVEDGKVRHLQSWAFTAPAGNGGYQSRFVYSDNCHPLIYRLEDQMVGYKFENVVPRIDDLSVFDVDFSGCVKGY